MPGSMPATSQLEWLSSTTAMIVLFWSRATRDLLKSFGWGIAALHRLHAATKLPSLAARPIASIGPPPEIVVDPSGSRRDQKVEVGMSFGETESSMSLPSRDDSAPAPKVSLRPTRVRSLELGITTLPDAGPMIRIRSPPPVSLLQA